MNGSSKHCQDDIEPSGQKITGKRKGIQKKIKSRGSISSGTDIKHCFPLEYRSDFLLLEEEEALLVSADQPS